jgi:hypothetical protein
MLRIMPVIAASVRRPGPGIPATQGESGPGGLINMSSLPKNNLGEKLNDESYKN